MLLFAGLRLDWFQGAGIGRVGVRFGLWAHGRCIDGYHIRLPCVYIQADERDTAAGALSSYERPQGGFASASGLGAH